jgi:uncharacterized membrane protein
MSQESPDSDNTSQPSRSLMSASLTRLTLGAPVRWLMHGWHDYRRCPGIGFFYGVCFFVMGHALFAVFHSAPQYVLALSAGFRLMGPFLSLGLYHASREIEQGRTPSLAQSLLAWEESMGAMAVFAGVLLILEMLWGRASLIVFAVTFQDVPDARNVLQQLLDPQNLEFLITYTCVGSVFAGLIFVTSVISIPAIMDRRADAISAGLTSIRACLENPLVMLTWGALIVLLMLAAMLPYFLGLIILGPLVGHATWHAYRDVLGDPASNISPSH